MTESFIYLDNNSTTRLAPEVLESMMPFFREQYANPASTTHPPGRSARKAVDEAREKIAAAINASPDEIVFTSGATEACNLALRGVATHRSSRSKRLITTATEHRAVLDPVRRLQKEGFTVDHIEVAPGTGEILPDSLLNALQDPADLIAIIMANNEIGTLMDWEKFGAAIRDSGVRVFSDAPQALGKIPIDVSTLPVDLLSFSAHKIHGPKGVGALYVRRGVRLKPIVDGGGHEGGKRSGTLNVPGIVGFGQAVELACENRSDKVEQLKKQTVRLWNGLSAELTGIHLNGPAIERRLPGNLNIRLDGIDAETLALKLPSVCLSTGSACTSAEPEPSHVLQAIGLTEMEARASVRISPGRFNTNEELDQAVREIISVVRELRQLNERPGA